MSEELAHDDLAGSSGLPLRRRAVGSTGVNSGELRSSPEARPLAQILLASRRILRISRRILRSSRRILRAPARRNDI